MLRVAICDDDTYFSNELRQRLGYAYSGQLAVSEYHDGAPLLHDLTNRLAAFDLFLLDMKMPCLDGIATGLRIREQDKFVPIIVISSFRDYLKDGYCIQPYQYLLKPLDDGQFKQVMGEAFSIIKMRKPETRVLIQTRWQSYHIQARDIISIESWRGKLLIFTEREQHVMYGRLSDYVKDLRADGFLLSHRSILVNANHILRIETQHKTAYLTGGKTAAISEDRIVELKHAYHQCVRHRLYG